MKIRRNLANYRGKIMFIRDSYSLDLVASAVVTMGVILLCVRIYLKAVNKKSKIQKPDWLGKDFDERFDMKGK